MIPQAFFSIGTTLANMQNFGVYFICPLQVPDGGRVPYTGSVDLRGVAPLLVRDGYVNGKLLLAISDSSELFPFIQAIYGGYSVDSLRLYVTALSEDEHYSPYLAYVERPSVADGTMPVVATAGGGRLKGVVVNLTDCILQFVTKAANYTRTTSNRLVYYDTASGNRTDTLPAASAVTPNTIYSAVISGAGHNVVITPAGSDTINGASTLTINGLNTRVDFYSDGVSAWYAV